MPHAIRTAFSMSYFRKILKIVVVALTSRPWTQRLLERTVVFLQDLMGIGTGGSPAWSGEKGLGKLLREQYASSRRPLCIFDVGANKGQFLSEVIQQLVAAGIPLRVHAFEPSRAAFDVLRAGFQDRRDVSLNNLGLGREVGEFPLFSNAPGSGLASLSQRRLGHIGLDFNTKESVRIEKLDDYCRQHEIERIDLLKLDVEGHELDVLSGGKRMFHEGRIGMVSFEFGGTHIDSRTFFQDFWYFFKENGGGTIYRITPAGPPFPIIEYREIYEQFRTTNFLVVISEAVRSPSP